MKYHYQYVSKTTVRIELIPEDKKEAAQVESLQVNELDNPQLIEFYTKGLQAYTTGAQLTRTNFMSFPKVALCSYAVVKEPVIKSA